MPLRFHLTDFVVALFLMWEGPLYAEGLNAPAVL